MKLRPFALERFFAKYEFTARYSLCSSDAESLSIEQLLAYEPDSEKALTGVWLGYAETRGNPALRRLIADSYGTVDDDGILVHSGANEPIFALMNALLEPGDHIVAQFPAYQSQYSVAEAIGAQMTPWNSRLEGDGAPDPDELAAAIRPNTRLIVITSPNNPTGYVFDRARLDVVIEIARKRGIWIFGDEVYRGSERDPADRHPPVCDLYERGVSLGGMAKSYALPGLRIGWIATHDADLYERISEIKDYLTICNSAPSEFLACVALRHGEALLARTNATTSKNLDLLDAFFARHGDWEWTRPKGGTTAFPRYVAGSTERFCDELVKNAGVLLLPSILLDAGDDRVRVGYGRKNLPEALAALEAYLERR